MEVWHTGSRGRRPRPGAKTRRRERLPLWDSSRLQWGGSPSPPTEVARDRFSDRAVPLRYASEMARRWQGAAIGPPGWRRYSVRGWSGLIRSTKGMARIRHRVHYGQKPLGELVELALAGLVGLHRNQRIVAALGLRGDGELADRARKPAPAGRFLGGRQALPEEFSGPLDGGVGGDRRPMIVFHVAG